MSESKRVAIVTGASHGIGASVVERLVTDGWLVVGGDLDAGHKANSEKFRMIVGDVALEVVWERLVRAARGMGRLDAVVNNAGVQGHGLLLTQTSLDDFARVLAINVHSCFLGTRAALQHGGDGSAVVNIASNAGSRGVPRFGPYVSAKHAVLGLTRTAALEAAKIGIRVNAVAPGPTNTKIMDDVARSFNADEPEAVKKRLTSANPTRRFGEPSEIATAVAWLIGPQAGYVNGSVLAVDGGLTAA